MAERFTSLRLALPRFAMLCIASPHRLVVPLGACQYWAGCTTGGLGARGHRGPTPYQLSWIPLPRHFLSLPHPSTNRYPNQATHTQPLHAASSGPEALAAAVSAMSSFLTPDVAALLAATPGDRVTGHGLYVHPVEGFTPVRGAGRGGRGGGTGAVG